MHSKIRKPMAIAALGVSAIVFDVAAWQGLSPRVSAWLGSGSGRAVATAVRTLGTELGATAARYSGDVAMRLALRAARESAGLFAMIHRISPETAAWAADETPALPELPVCVLASSVPAETAELGTASPRVVVVIARCSRAAGARSERRIERRMDRLSLQAL